MGEYAEIYMEQQMREEGQRMAREAARDVDLGPLRTFAAAHDLVVVTPSPHHVQVREAPERHGMKPGDIFAEWWPTKGTTMMGGRRGPRCLTTAALLAWLKSV